MKLNKPMWVLLDPEKQEAAWDWESMITGTRQWKALKAVKVILTNAPTKYQAGTVPKVWKKAAKPSAA